MRIKIKPVKQTGSWILSGQRIHPDSVLCNGSALVATTTTTTTATEKHYDRKYATTTTVRMTATATATTADQKDKYPNQAITATAGISNVTVVTVVKRIHIIPPNIIKDELSSYFTIRRNRILCYTYKKGFVLSKAFFYSIQQYEIQGFSVTPEIRLC